MQDIKDQYMEIIADISAICDGGLDIIKDTTAENSSKELKEKAILVGKELQEKEQTYKVNVEAVESLIEVLKNHANSVINNIKNK